jgi:hypothetical protein
VFLRNAGKIHPLYEPGYVASCVGNLTEGKSCVSTRISEFPIAHMKTGSTLKIGSSNFLKATQQSTSLSKNNAYRDIGFSDFVHRPDFS